MHTSQIITLPIDAANGLGRVGIECQSMPSPTGRLISGFATIFRQPVVLYEEVFGNG